MKAMTIEINPFHVVDLMECTIIKKMNEHILVKVNAYIREIEDVLGIENIIIEIIDEEGLKKPVFRGMITKISHSVEGNLTKISFEAKSYTALLECDKKIRVFQDEKQSYRKIVDFINEKNKNVGTIFCKESGKLTDGMIVQYNETDWEFLKRIASRLNTYIVPDCIGNHTCYYFGLSEEKKEASIEIITYTKLLHKKLKGQSAYLEYMVDSRDIIELGTPLRFLDQKFFVFEVESKLIGGEWIHQYYIRPKSRLRVEKLENNQIAGISLLGKVHAIKGEMVKVDFTCDDDVKKNSSKWFPYATVYSASGGIGWYCMPEKEEEIAIYFPDNEENHAYATGTAHRFKDDKNRKDPDIKSMRTIHDKEIRFEPERIIITNHKGLSIILDDNQGIIIKSSSAINFVATEGVNLESGEGISIMANQGIRLKQNENSIVIHNGIRQNGLSIRYK